MSAAGDSLPADELDGLSLSEIIAEEEELLRGLWAGTIDAPPWWTRTEAIVLVGASLMRRRVQLANSNSER